MKLTILFLTVMLTTSCSSIKQKTRERIKTKTNIKEKIKEIEYSVIQVPKDSIVMEFKNPIIRYVDTVIKVKRRHIQTQVYFNNKGRVDKVKTTLDSIQEHKTTEREIERETNIKEDKKFKEKLYNDISFYKSISTGLGGLILGIVLMVVLMKRGL